MSFLDYLFIKLFNKKIGEDQFGNKYYESNNIDCYKLKKRYVIYKGRTEPSKVPPMWHAWLHHLRNNPPTTDTSLTWQLGYTPNLTGTKLAYNIIPVGPKAESVYNKWQPK